MEPSHQSHDGIPDFSRQTERVSPFPLLLKGRLLETECSVSQRACMNVHFAQYNIHEHSSQGSNNVFERLFCKDRKLLVFVVK